MNKRAKQILQIMGFLMVVLGTPLQATVEDYGISLKEKKPLSTQNNLWVRKAEDYLNAIQYLMVSFLQDNPDGSVSGGFIYLSRPYKMRIEYDEPSKLLILSDGQFITQYDPELDETSRMEVELTPASLFLTKPVRFSGKVQVKNIQEESDKVLITVVKVGDEGGGELTFMFSKSPFDLVGWSVLDVQGQKTQVRLSEMKVYPKTLDYSLFRLHKDEFKRSSPEDRFHQLIEKIR